MGILGYHGMGKYNPKVYTMYFAQRIGFLTKRTKDFLKWEMFSDTLFNCLILKLFLPKLNQQMGLVRPNCLLSYIDVMRVI